MKADAMPTEVRVFGSFEETGLDSAAWNRIASRGDTHTFFQTLAYQKTWWEEFGRGQLMILTAGRDRTPQVLAPLFIDGGMVFLVGSGGSDYLDFIGEARDPEVLACLLGAVRKAAPGLLGFRFYLVPDASRTGAGLQAAAESLGLDCHDEGSLPAPALSSGGQSEVLVQAAGRKSMIRHERYFQREGHLVVEHLRDAAAITPRLEEFFEQHVARWRGTSAPSLFEDPAQRAFYRRLTAAAAADGLIRFSRVVWNGTLIAAHFGFLHGGTFLWYKPSFDPALARHSPGEVLLRHLLLASAEEGVDTFDFGIGDEPFKQRFANQVPEVRTWGLYPSSPGETS